MVLKPTMKELQLSKGAIWNPRSKFGKEMQRKTGIKAKGTHFKMDVGQRKVGLSDLLIIRARDDDSLNDFSRRVELMAVPAKASKKHK